MIQIKLNDIMNSTEVFKFLQEQMLSARVAYKIGKIVIVLENELQVIQEARYRIVDKYGARDDDGNLIVNDGQYTIAPDNIDKVNEEFKELMNTEINLNVEPIALNELEEYNITPSKMIALMPFIEE